jgi:glutamate dehydrogenase
MHRILLAPVDLFYNGGIGTYIKASTETHAQVKDRANDNIRVNGNELRCKVVAEGGNLGATQAGRIEFALAGGRIFTDAIDNSAGVDCSDHEVNVKIWLDTEVNAGQLPEADRNRILNEMTGDVEHLVLRDNTHQTHLLVREAQAQGDGMVDGYAALIASLESEGAVSRELEQLPSEPNCSAARSPAGPDTPELAVVIANVKNRFKRTAGRPAADRAAVGRDHAASVLPGAAGRHPQAAGASAGQHHPGHRAGQRVGQPLRSADDRDLALEHRIDEVEVVKAWGQAWSALHLAPVFEALDADALNVPRDVSQGVDARTRACCAP